MSVYLCLQVLIIVSDTNTTSLLHFSVGTARSPHSFPTPLFLHRLIECHTSVFSLSFQLRAGLHHSVDFYILSRSHLFSTNRLIFVNQPFVVSCPSQRPDRPYQGLQAYCRSPRLPFKEVPVIQSILFPQINLSCMAVQMLCGYNTETDVEDPVQAFK